ESTDPWSPSIRLSIRSSSRSIRAVRAWNLPLPSKARIDPTIEMTTALTTTPSTFMWTPSSTWRKDTGRSLPSACDTDLHRFAKEGPGVVGCDDLSSMHTIARRLEQSIMELVRNLPASDAAPDLARSAVDLAVGHDVHPETADQVRDLTGELLAE